MEPPERERRPGVPQDTQNDPKRHSLDPQRHPLDHPKGSQASQNATQRQQFEPQDPQNNQKESLERNIFKTHTPDPTDPTKQHSVTGLVATNQAAFRHKVSGDKSGSIPSRETRNAETQNPETRGTETRHAKPRNAKLRNAKRRNPAQRNANPRRQASGVGWAGGETPWGIRISGC